MKKYRYYFLLGAIFVFFGLNNYVWLRMDSALYYDDLAYHMVAALNIADSSHGFLSRLSTGLHSVVINFYPPFFHWVMANFIVWFGRSPLSAAMANLPFLGAFILSIHFIARKMGRESAGPLAAFVALSYLGVHGLMRLTLPDFALTAMLAVSVCCLIYSDDFSRRSFSLLFGISCGIGMLVKQLFILFILPPAAFTICYLVIGRRILDRRILFNIMLSLLAACAIAGYWYVLNFSSIWPEYIRASYVDGLLKGDSSIFSYHSIVFNARNLINNQMLPVFFYVFLAGLAIWIWRARQAKYQWLLCFSIIATYILFVLILTKVQKTTAPYLFYFALITAMGITSWRTGPMKKILISLLVVFGLLQYGVANYGILSGITKGRLIDDHRLDNEIASAGKSFRPRTYPNPAREIVSIIRARSDGRAAVTIGAINETVLPYFYRGVSSLAANMNGIVYVVKREKLPFRVEKLDNIHHFNGTGTYPDFIVLVDDLQNHFVRKDCEEYRLLRSLTMPDRTRVNIFERVRSDQAISQGGILVEKFLEKR